MEIPEHAAINRDLCPGIWQEVSDSRCRSPRPTLVELADPWNSDRFLVLAGRIKAMIRGEKDAATGRIRAKAAKKGSLGFNTMLSHVPKLRINNMGEVG